MRALQVQFLEIPPLTINVNFCKTILQSDLITEIDNILHLLAWMLAASAGNHRKCDYGKYGIRSAHAQATARIV